jgi:twinkle protein
MFETIQDKNNDTWDLIGSWADIGVAGSTGTKTALCICSPDRKHNPKQKCLSVNFDDGTAFCSHCEKRFMIKNGTTNQKKTSGSNSMKKQYKKPNVKILPDIPDNLLSWLMTDRKITSKVIERNRLGHSIKYFPKTAEQLPCISFPYYKDGQITGVKYRLPEPKDWTAETGAEPIVYGYDDIKGDVLIWVEGELDKLAVEVAGYENCVSVPNGAKSAGSLANVEDKLKTVKTHIIAVDNDGSGSELEEDLIRRLNPAKCKIVKWIPGCKDANQVLIDYDQYAVKNCINDAEKVPIEGIIKPTAVIDKLINVYRTGIDHGLSTGWDNVDKLYRVKKGQWTVVTGVPNHGKSEWLDALACNMITDHGWKFGVFSPENYPLETHVQKYIKKLIGKPFGKEYNGSMSEELAIKAVHQLDKHLTFVGAVEDTHDIDSLLGLTESLVLSEGINGMILDPWNTIEHNRPASMTETEYISSALSKITFLVRRLNIHLWLVAHPTKLQKDSKGGYIPPLPYDISGSAHWFNKSDAAITVHIHDEGVGIHVNKIRFRENGRPGKTILHFDEATGRYS